MNKVEKYYPSGILHPDYVESLFDQLILPDQERLAEKLADRFDLTECVEVDNNEFSMSDVEDKYGADEIVSQYGEECILDYINIDTAINHYGAYDLLENIPDDIVKRYAEENL